MFGLIAECNLNQSLIRSAEIKGEKENALLTKLTTSINRTNDIAFFMGTHQ